ncbi:MAG: fixJ [Caulobacter sp.]|nr:fixJ [Caulobacter sp.]
MNTSVIHIVDDDEAVRRALSLLAQSAGHPVAAHSSAESFLANVPADSGGCVVTDVRMPGMTGLQLQQAMRDRGLDLPIIMMTGHGDVAMAVEALKAGADDFLEKPFDDRVFLGSVGRALIRGQQLRRSRLQRDEIARRTALLTAREQEVMALIVEGAPNQAVADRLGISVRTVENHRARIMDKMQAKRFSDLVRMVLTGVEAPED